MKNVVLVKNNVVVAIEFAIDADVVALNNEAKLGDVYNPADGTFTTPTIEEDVKSE